ncbi:erythromycin esterase family protein [Bradyrhizobium sp. 139]|uniref:erythromycin esterase family protein n=1 Tax=Bradyrhizobium sp. 139 TaxID=2782616 RepID=UPI0021123322|nr:erythromycin esterase family protein [Bradyrhizobium sp. 139]
MRRFAPPPSASGLPPTADVTHQSSHFRKGTMNETARLRRRLLEPRLERFIGVIYRPITELQSHYAEASLPQQFDAFLWFDETHAVGPLGPEHRPIGVPDTYPFGL